MSSGLRAHQADVGEHEVDRSRLGQLELSGAGATTAVLAPPHVRALLRLQRTAGNTAVTQLLRGGPAPSAIGMHRELRHAARTTAQRQDDEYAGSGQSWGTDEEAGGSEYSSGGDYGGGYAGGETYGPPPPPESGDEGSQWSGGGGGESSGSGGAGGESSGGGGGGGGGGESSGGGGGGGDDEGGSSWWPFDGGGGGGSGEGDGGSSWWPFDGGGEGSGGEDDGGRSVDDIQKKIDEGETDSLTDEYVPQGGSGYPFARVAGPAGRRERALAEDHGGFHDDGQSGTVPFGDDATDATDPGKADDPDELMHPHAYTGGGSTGTVTWAGGGGAGRGPKGNQATGSIQTEVVPAYDSKWGGIRTNASAWVRAGTGTADVHRDYVTTASGDQGNGWWVSQLAASALTAHEQKHVAASKSVYDTTIQPMLDRVGNSATYGNEITYWQSEALILLKRYVGWADALKRFKDDDAAYNANFGQVDSEDFGSAHYPRNMKGPRKIGGKDYDNYLIMGSEPDPT